MRKSILFLISPYFSIKKKQLELTKRGGGLLYQRVICLSVTSETRHDTRNQKESLRGRAPRPYSGHISLNFGGFWDKYEHLDASISAINHIN